MSIRPYYLLALLLAVAAAAYSLGLGGGFLFDDVIHINLNQRLQLEELSLAGLYQASLSSHAGPLGRPLSMLSLCVDYYLAGLNPAAFKLTNIFIHLLCGLALFRLACLLMRAYHLSRSGVEPATAQVTAVALTATALWLLHPLNLSSVLYIVQRMTSLSALFSLLALGSYASARLRLMRGQPAFARMTVGVVGFGLLAVFSKETGALLPLYLLVTEGILFRFATATLEQRRRLILWFAIMVGVPLAAVAGFLLTSFDWIAAGYSNRDFTLTERLLTEARVIWLYLQWALLPLPSSLGLFHDDIALSRALLTPWTTLPALAGVLGLLLAVALTARRAPLLAFGLGWFLAGHALESTVIALELVHEHRNYLPLAGLALSAAAGLDWLARLKPRAPIRALSVLALSLMAAGTAVRAYDWGEPLRMAVTEAKHHPGSSRSAFSAGNQLLQEAVRRKTTNLEEYARIKAHFQRSLDADRNAVLGYFGLTTLARHYGQAVDPGWIEEMSQRLRSRDGDPIGILLGFNDLMNKVQGVEISTEQFTGFVTAAMDNPRATNYQKSQLLLVLARHLRGKGNYPHAVQLVIAATHYEPESPLPRIELVKLALRLDNHELARTEIERIRQLDRIGRHSYELKKLEMRLKPAP